MNNTERAIYTHPQPLRRARGYRACVVAVKMREPITDPADRRNYVCASCGRAWRQRSGKYQCPYCGYFEEARP